MTFRIKVKTIPKRVHLDAAVLECSNIHDLSDGINTLPCIIMKSGNTSPIKQLNGRTELILIPAIKNETDLTLFYPYRNPSLIGIHHDL